MYESYLVNTQEFLYKTLALLKEAPVLALDTETTGLDPKNGKIVGISLCFNDKSAYYIPLRHGNYAKNLEEQFVLTALREATKGKLIVMHNSKFDYRFFKHAGWVIENEIFDTMIADYLLDPDRSHSLDNCSLRELDMVKITTEEIIGKGETQITFDKVDAKIVCKYAAEDAYCTYKLYTLFEPRLRENKQYKLFRSIEMPLMYVLAYMEETGVYIDTMSLVNLTIIATKELKKLKLKIKDQITDKKRRKSFNPASNDDLSWLLYRHLALTPSFLTDKGKPSVSREAIEDLSTQHPVAALLLEYKQKSKILSFLKKLPTFKDEQTERIHCSLNQLITKTGRLSTSEPSSQNIPSVKRDENDNLKDCVETNLRRSFKPQLEGWSILALDYSQIELRLLAVLASEPSMLETFKHPDGDIHTLTASKIHKKELSQVSKAERKQAKGINFGISYGMGAKTLAKRTEVSKAEAQLFIDNFLYEYSAINEFHKTLVAEARTKGYLTTLYGRRRYLKHINSNNNRLRSQAERFAKNFPIQGLGADLMKIAMIKCYELIKEKTDEIKMILSIHDELVFEVRDDKAEEYKEKITEIMQSVLPKPYSDHVTLLVEAKTASTWADAH